MCQSETVGRFSNTVLLAWGACVDNLFELTGTRSTCFSTQTTALSSQDDRQGTSIPRQAQLPLQRPLVYLVQPVPAPLVTLELGPLDQSADSLQPPRSQYLAVADGRAAGQRGRHGPGVDVVAQGNVGVGRKKGACRDPLLATARTAIRYRRELNRPTDVNVRHAADRRGSCPNRARRRSSGSSPPGDTPRGGIGFAGPGRPPK